MGVSDTEIPFKIWGFWLKITENQVSGGWCSIVGVCVGEYWGFRGKSEFGGGRVALLHRSGRH